MNYRLLAYNCLSRLEQKAVAELRHKITMIECMKNDALDFDEEVETDSYWKAMERTVEETLNCTVEERNAIIDYFLE